MSGFRGTALAAVAVVALAAAFTASASGAAGSTVTVGIGYATSGSSPYFRGLVKSGRKTCIANRPVKVYRVKNEGRRVLFGSDRSGTNGDWLVPLAAQMPTAGYVAVVKAKAGCEKAFSDPIGVGQRGPDGVGPGGTA